MLNFKSAYISFISMIKQFFIKKIGASMIFTYKIVKVVITEMRKYFSSKDYITIRQQSKSKDFLGRWVVVKYRFLSKDQDSKILLLWS